MFKFELLETVGRITVLLAPAFVNWLRDTLFLTGALTLLSTFTCLLEHCLSLGEQPSQERC